MSDNSENKSIDVSDAGVERVLSRTECLEILGLPENADDNAVKQRYGGLLRQYKRHVDEKGTTYDDLEYYKKITTAYDTIMGFSHDFGDDNPTSPIPYKIRRKWGKFLTVVDQYKLLIILGVLVVILGVFFVIQRSNTQEEDISIKFVGAFGSAEQQKVIDGLNTGAQSFDSANVSFFTVTTSTTIMDTAAKTYAQSFLSQLMAGALDVVLIDKESFDVYVEQGHFLRLDDLLASYSQEGGDISSLKTYSYEGKTQGDRVIYASGIYGIEVSESTLVENLPGLTWLYDEEAGQEKTMIFTICAGRKISEDDKRTEEVAWNFGKELIATIVKED